MTGDYLRSCRLKLKLTQGDVASAIGVSRNMVHAMETRSKIPVRLIKPLAKVLKIQMLEIVESMTDDYFIRLFDELGLDN